MERVTSAAAERNKQPIVEALRTLLPERARVLEIASGGGQHVVHFAQQLPWMQWQPTERGADELAAIASRIAAAGVTSVAPPCRLDVMESPWPVETGFDAVLCINMIHISPWEATPALFEGAARHLAAHGPGRVVLYGPYREGGEHTAPSNAQFEQWLLSLDPRFGVRNLEDVEAVALRAGFRRTHLLRLPANNLLLAFALR